jgi:ABC-2 type transport system ATP-binding protein
MSTTSNSPPAIAANNLHKSFGKTQALRGVDLTVPAGTVCGLLGPNGAGKTTAVRILATLAAPDQGEARVAGFDVVRQADEVRRRIGFTGQHAALEEGVTGRENLLLLGRLHHLGGRAARRRAEELLEQFELGEAADRLVRGYSGGMRRRLDLIASLITRPQVLFLDEPTTGLDPRSRNAIWETIRELAHDGITVLLTTQYLDEADQLADDIVVVDHGVVIASGTPQRLKETIGSRIEVTLADAEHLPIAARTLAEATGGEPATDVDELRVTVVASAQQGSGSGGPGDTVQPVTLPALVRLLDTAGVSPLDVALRSPSLDEVFLKLTGGQAARTAGTLVDDTAGDDAADTASERTPA